MDPHYLRLFETSTAVKQSEPGSIEWADSVRGEAVALARHVQSAYIRLSHLVYTVYGSHIDNDPHKPPLYIHWGYESLQDWAEKELGFHPRKTHYLKQIHHVLFVVLKDMDPELRERLCDLDFSKVREVVGVLTLDNALQWAILGEQHNYATFSRKITEYRGLVRQAMVKHQRDEESREETQKALAKESRREAAPAQQVPSRFRVPDPTQAPGVDVPDPDPPEEKREHRGFYLYPLDLKIVDKAIEVSEAISGSTVKSHNLGLICMDFLATNGAALPGTESLIHYFSNLDRIFGIKTVVFENRLPTGSMGRPPELYYGAPHLTELIDALNQFYPPMKSKVRESLREMEADMTDDDIFDDFKERLTTLMRGTKRDEVIAFLQAQTPPEAED